ncbi:MAG: hypothetical protein RMM17_11240 [Acidobacteriota bacterium]|nr:hypothetical protein [Blastocatellia bacterium]MDW8413245.1 hypothetical protein [Acidobacteriota bacterium]
MRGDFGCIATLLCMIAVFLLGLYLLRWPSLPIEGSTILDLVGGIVCFFWLLVVLKVPWDLHFEAERVLFELRRAQERGIAVNVARQDYVRRLSRRMIVAAIGAHVGSAAVVAAATYWSGGRIGYLFAFFYLVTTFLRPASQGYRAIKNRLTEIESEAKYPREDVVKLKAKVEEVCSRVEVLEKSLEAIKSAQVRLDEQMEQLGREIRDLRQVIESCELSYARRINDLRIEVEQAVTKAVDRQEIISGLQSLVKLFKEA